MFHLQQKCFLKLLDLSPEEITGLLDLAADLKAKKKAGIPHALHTGKNIALIFEKTSTRTRCAKKKALPILPGFWAVCMTALNTAVLASRS